MFTYLLPAVSSAWSFRRVAVGVALSFSCDNDRLQRAKHLEAFPFSASDVGSDLGLSVLQRASDILSLLSGAHLPWPVKWRQQYRPY